MFYKTKLIYNTIKGPTENLEDFKTGSQSVFHKEMFLESLSGPPFCETVILPLIYVLCCHNVSFDI